MIDFARVTAALSDRFEILEKIGEGGMGVVLRARQRSLGREVALKIVSFTIPEAAARFRSEAQALARLDHPAIVGLYDADLEGDTPYFVMELVEGRSLSRVLAEGPLPIRRALDIAADLAAGLAHAHGFGIVHRDVKPDNVLLTHSGEVRLADFGIARWVGHSLPRGGVITQPGLVLGSPAYMSPEQINGEDVGPALDVYGLGVTLFQALTGELPFLATEIAELLQAHLHEPAPAPSTRRPGIPPAVDRLVLAMMEKDVTRRIPDGAALEQAIDAARSQLTADATPTKASDVAARASPEILSQVPGLPSNRAVPSRVPGLPSKTAVAARAPGVPSNPAVVPPPRAAGRPRSWRGVALLAVLLPALAFGLAAASRRFAGPATPVAPVPPASTPSGAPSIAPVTPAAPATPTARASPLTLREALIRRCHARVAELTQALDDPLVIAIPVKRQAPICTVAFAGHVFHEAQEFFTPVVGGQPVGVLYDSLQCTQTMTNPFTFDLVTPTPPPDGYELTLVTRPAVRGVTAVLSRPGKFGRQAATGVISGDRTVFTQNVHLRPGRNLLTYLLVNREPAVLTVESLTSTPRGIPPPPVARPDPPLPPMTGESGHPVRELDRAHVEQDFERVVELYRKLTGKQAKAELVRMRYGEALMRTGRLPEAIEVLDECLQTGPDRSWNWHNMSSALKMQGRIREARRLAIHCLRLEQPEFFFWLALARLDHAAGEIERGVIDYEIAIQCSPERTEPYSELMHMLSDAGQRERGMAIIRRYVPDHPAALMATFE